MLCQHLWRCVSLCLRLEQFTTLWCQLWHLTLPRTQPLHDMWVCHHILICSLSLCHCPTLFFTHCHTTDSWRALVHTFRINETHGRECQPSDWHMNGFNVTLDHTFGLSETHEHVSQLRECFGWHMSGLLMFMNIFSLHEGGDLPSPHLSERCCPLLTAHPPDGLAVYFPSFLSILDSLILNSLSLIFKITFNLLDRSPHESHWLIVDLSFSD